MHGFGATIKGTIIVHSRKTNYNKMYHPLVKSNIEKIYHYNYQELIGYKDYNLINIINQTFKIQNPSIKLSHIIKGKNSKTQSKVIFSLHLKLKRFHLHNIQTHLLLPNKLFTCDCTLLFYPSVFPNLLFLILNIFFSLYFFHWF